MSHEDWGEGPWNNEDDHAVWVDPATNLDCMINRGPSGALCGYVGVPPSHPWHGVDYTAIVKVEVHGGLTYANSCQEDGEICHVPEPGREHDIWWFGFDCAHAFDLAPQMEATMRELRKRKPEIDHIESLFDGAGRYPGVFPGNTYRDWNYVVKEVTDLAAQLAAIQ